MLGVLSNYQLLKRLAVGGMAEIFLARQELHGGLYKLVAIKRVRPNLAVQERFVQMFLDEARLAARFNHPNIVQITDLGQHENAYYIAMEYIHGEDIKSIIRRCSRTKQRLPLEHATKIGAEILGGLHYAHTQKIPDRDQLGVVHRDVSPHNVIVSFQGGVKLIDFGIAKARGAIAQEPKGRVKGKLAYMSPEQVRNQDLDGRSDIFALGIVLYELLTWTRLFKQRDNDETLRAVCQMPVRPLRDFNPAITPTLEAIVLKALERDLSRRYQTAQQMQLDLEDCLLKEGLRSNQALLGQFVSGLFAEKLRARDEALASAQATDLAGAVLGGDGQAPDLVAFLDMFFGDSGSTSYRTSSLQVSADSLEHTPTGDDLPSPMPGKTPSLENRPLEIPARVRPGKLQSQVDPGLGDMVDPGAGFQPQRRAGGFWKIGIVLVVLFGLVALGFAFKDELFEPPAPVFGSVSVLSEPAGAQVYLDGTLQPGLTPLVVKELAPDRQYEIRLAMQGLRDWKTFVQFEEPVRPQTVKAILAKD